MPILLQINVTANWGSTGKIAEQIGQVAMSHGWESYIAYGRMANPSKSKLIKIGSMFDVYGHYAENLFLDNEGLASRRATKSFLKVVDEIKPDIVHLHNIHDHYINYKLLFEYLTQKRIPVVWTQHDQWATTGHCMYNLCGCEKWKDECHECPLSKWFSLDRSQRNYRLKKISCAGIPSLTIIPVSEWLADNIRLSHLSNRPIQVIHNGIDIQMFKPQPTDAYERYNIDRNKKIVLSVAAVGDTRKWLSDFEQIAKRLPEEEYVIVIVGKVPGRLQNIGGGCPIIYIERTQHDLELAQLYSSASVFVNPTHQDNYLTTNMEAIACGTPVITYRTGGSLESVDDRIGAVVEPGDISGLLASIKRFSSGDCKLDCMEKAECLVDNRKCINPYIRLYNKLLEGGKTIILGVSSVWNRSKGLEDFIELSKNPDYIVILIGLSLVQIKELNRLDYNGCNIIPIARTQNQHELACLYSLADVFVNPTYADMFPTVNLEALACGTPVVTYCTGGSPEAIDNNTGIVVEQGNIEQMIEAINSLKEHQKTVYSCRKRAESCFDAGKCYEEYMSLYKSLI